MTVTNVLIAGVGGQGSVLASELLALAAGVAQRGGAVFSHVRFGDRVYSPAALRGKVDYLLALEKLEALRYAHFVKPGGTIIVNEHTVEPIRVADKRPYPTDTVEFLGGKGYRVVVLDATAQAIELGNHRAANVVLLGTLAESLDIPFDVWDKTLHERIPERLLDLNRRAFAAGREAAGGEVATAQS
jgi:indolepyruvate ferredoxin oxidoreductase beta subunit